MKKILYPCLILLAVCLGSQPLAASTITVTNTNDSGTGSLRAAITNANSGDMINFSVSGTITFASSIVWNKSLTIMGGGNVTLNGNGTTGLFEIDGGRNQIQGLTFSNAHAADGACILGPSGNSTDSILIYNCTFVNGTASDNAGAVVASNGRYLLMDNCTVSNCVCTQNLGGGVTIFTGIIENCTFNNCSAANEAGALWTFAFAVTVQNCTFANNSSQLGGAIYSEIDLGTLTLINNTFSGNTATIGGANLAVETMIGPGGGTSATFENNIFNGAGNNFYNDGGGTFTGTSAGGNICSDGSMSSFLTGTNDQNNVNAMLGTLANNGGPTQTIALLCSSPAINNGVTSGAPTTDQRGNPRIGGIDAGSYQVASGTATVSQNIAICPGDSLVIGDSIYKSTGLYTNTTSNGCADTTLITSLTVYTPATFNQTIALCPGDTLTVGNHHYHTAGTFHDTLNTIHGCDSVITTHLSVRQPNTQFSGNTFCGSGSVTVGNHTYTTAGMFIDTLTASTGCDSIITTVIQILPNDTTHQTLTICAGDSLTVGTSTYKNNGNYTDILSNMTGCDSVVYTHLTVGAPLVSAQAFNICGNDSVVVGSDVYKTAGTYTNVFSSVSGCDSTVTTTVTVRAVSTFSQSLTICKGEHVTVGGNVHDTAGTYIDVLTSGNGCDSTVTTTLTVYRVDTAVTPNGTSLVANTGTGKTYQWINCDNNTPVSGATSQIFTPTVSGNYAVVETQNNCIDTSACYTVTVTGIANTFADMAIRVFPNPTNSVVNIAFGKIIANGHITVFDLFGRQLMEQPVPLVNTMTLDMATYANGIYFIEVSDNIHSSRTKVVKE